MGTSQGNQRNHAQILTRNIGLDVRCHAEYRFGMITTIDGAGQVVVPRALRERFNLAAGTELEIVADFERFQLPNMVVTAP